MSKRGVKSKTRKPSKIPCSTCLRPFVTDAYSGSYYGPNYVTRYQLCSKCKREAEISKQRLRAQDDTARPATGREEP